MEARETYKPSLAMLKRISICAVFIGAHLVEMAGPGACSVFYWCRGSACRCPARMDVAVEEAEVREP